MMDILNPEEYQLFLPGNRFHPLVPTFEGIEEIALLDIEHARLFLSEKLYALAFAYRAIVGRVGVLLENDVKKGHVNPWFHDAGIKRLLGEVLTVEEMKEFEGLARLRVKWTRNFFEAKILEDLRKVIAGDQSVNEGLEQAHRIMEVVRAVDSTTNESRLA